MALYPYHDKMVYDTSIHGFRDMDNQPITDEQADEVFKQVREEKAKHACTECYDYANGTCDGCHKPFCYDYNKVLNEMYGMKGDERCYTCRDDMY